MKLLQIVPRLEPDREGVSSVASALARAMGLNDAHDSELIALGHAGAARIAPPVESRLRRARVRAAELERRAGQVESGGAVVLHYVGYGYQSRGVPLWLASAWEGLRRSRGDLQLGIAFHEVFASGSPWQSSFWLSGWQRLVARRLLSASDAAVTSLAKYRDLLSAMVREKVVDVLAIPSTIGEPPFVPPCAERQLRLVVFGSEGVRMRAFQREFAALESAVRGLGVHEVMDIGSGSVAPRKIAGVLVRPMGALPSAEVSRLLLESRAGFLAYPPDYLDKSTIYGAYLAHGMVPVCAWSGRRGRAPRADEAWVRATADGFDGLVDLEAVARRAREAYAGRSIARHAELWQRRLFPE